MTAPATQSISAGRWQAHLVPVIYGLADKRIETGEAFETRPLKSLWSLTPSAKPKMQGLAFLPSLYSEHDARDHKIQRERGQFVALVADVDKGNHSIEQIEGAVQTVADGIAYLIHSTANAVGGDMRWRVILPLDEPLGFDDWRDAQVALFNFMGEQGIEADGVTQRAGQISFLPNVPAVHDKTGEALRGTDRSPLFYDARSSETEAPGLRIDQGPIAAAIAEVERKRAEDDRLREKMREDAARRRTSRPSNDGESIIDAFNRTTPITDMLVRCGYKQSRRNENDWRSPNQTSGSYATRVMGEKWVSLSGSDAAAGIGERCEAGCHGDAFDLFVHYDHGGDRNAAWAELCRERDDRNRPYSSLSEEAPPFHPDDPGYTELPEWASEERRERQRAENIAIGEGSDTIPTATVHSLDEMLDRFVFIKDGSQVAPADRPQSVLALADFRNAMAASKHWIEVDGKKKGLPAVKCWLESPKRLEAETLTFRAGGSAMTTDPNTGGVALNLWTGITRPEPPSDWVARSKIFVDHIEWLWGADADKFLDWLAHIEQRPGTLPHYGWVHISREHGKGRNWISSALTRVWPGYVAASLDLIPLLEGSFNGRLSRKLLAIVDEINEGGNSSYRHAQKLREIVTKEHRDINPKYGRSRVEYNSCRWLMFSNHTGALPLTEEDRRFWIVAHEGAPKDGAYYTRLYEALADPLFIASLAEFLQCRDLANFRAGEHPPMNNAKAELVAFSQSEDDVRAKEIAAHWPVDIILACELTGAFGDDGVKRPAVRHALDRAGIRKLPKKLKFYTLGTQNAYAIRNFGQWAAATPQQQKDHVNSVRDSEKATCLDIAE